MTEVVVVATIRPLPEHRAEVIAAMEKVIADVHAHDDGCLLYALHEGDTGWSWSRSGPARRRSTSTHAAPRSPSSTRR